MREIKFRAWVDTYSRWHMITSFALSADGSFFSGGIYSKSKPEWKLLQYTGLKDKNGREIYEGDIIRWKDIVADYETHCNPNIPTPTNTHTERYDTRVKTFVDSVVKIKGSFVLTRDADSDWIPIDFSSYYGCGLDIADEDVNELTEDDYFKSYGYDSIEALLEDVTSGVEIIGNIHENPELLEV